MMKLINKLKGEEKQKPPLDLQCYTNNFNGPGCKACPFLTDCKTHHNKKTIRV
ncbi:unnamed protein product [marine sediment metagenome]|uniref:Uncharacterized protein n=1 Tax=marine sediment metagenome TaxID=412755 RepID=X1TRA6_9ZZZZ